MIRKKVSKVIDTIYSKTFEDDAVEFKEPSRTQQAYYSECDIYNILARGGVAARPLQFGNQSYDSLDDILRIRREYELKFATLSAEDKAKFGTLDTYIKWVSDPSNYVPEVLPGIPEKVEEKKEKVEDKKEKVTE